MDRGELLGDDEMVAIVSERLARPDAANGFILDGFPRTVPQAQALDRMLQGQPLVIIDLAVPDAELMQRMQGRRVCSKCAAIAEPEARARGRVRAVRRQMMTRADDEDETGAAASARGVRAREQAAARLLPRAADVPLDQRRADARSGRDGPGGEHRRDGAGDVGAPADDRLPIGRRAASGCAM